MDILDDEDEDDLDGEEDGDLDGTHVDYQHVYPAASSNQSTRPPQQGIPLPTNNYLSISHIISPNTPHTLSQPLPAEKMREATQASTSSTSTNAPSNTFIPTQQKQGIFFFFYSFSFIFSSPFLPVICYIHRLIYHLDNVKKDVHVENEDSLDLFKENRHLRKKVCLFSLTFLPSRLSLPLHQSFTSPYFCLLLSKEENTHFKLQVEGLMGHNMQLMLGIKERDHKIFNQKRLLLKYRKAYVTFPSSSSFLLLLFLLLLFHLLLTLE